MTPNDAQALADARRFLSSIADKPNQPTEDLTVFTDEQRAERLKRRARARDSARLRWFRVE